MTAAVVVEGLVTRFGARYALAGVSFSVERGQIAAIVGEAGAGKTTLLESILGVRSPDHGRISVLGRAPAVASAWFRRTVGWHRQATSLPQRIRVDEAISTFARLRLGGGDVGGILDRFELDGLRRARFGSLAEAERLRVHLALALLGSPRVVLLDEVTSEYSADARREAWRWIDAVRGEGAAVVMATSFVDEIAAADRVLAFRQGVLVDADTPQGLTRRHGGGTTFRFAHPAMPTEWLLRIPGVALVHDDGSTVQVWGTADCLSRVRAALAGRDVTPEDLHVESGGLDHAVRHPLEMAPAA